MGTADAVADSEAVVAVGDGAVVWIVGRCQRLSVQEDSRSAFCVIRESEVVPFASREREGLGGEEGAVGLEAEREGNGVLVPLSAREPGAVVPVRPLELA